MLRRLFAPGSVILAHELAKLARLRFNAVGDASSAAEAAAVLHSAADALSASYGPEFEEVGELRHLERLCHALRS